MVSLRTKERLLAQLNEHGPKGGIKKESSIELGTILGKALGLNLLVVFIRHFTGFSGGSEI